MARFSGDPRRSAAPCGAIVDELAHAPTQSLSLPDRGWAMALEAVFFDVGETLVDEERWWRELCAHAGLQPHVVWAALGVTIERGEEHDELWRHLGIDQPARWWTEIPYSLEDLYPDAIGCLERVRGLGLTVGIVGN